MGEWMPGMYGTYAGVPCTCQKSHLQHSVRLIDLDALGGCTSRHRMGVCSYDATQGHFKPDLTDPATLGCLLAMVRARHGAYTYTLPTGRGWRVLLGNPDERFVSIVSAKEEMPTEAHALVAALAKGRS